MGPADPNARPPLTATDEIYSTKSTTPDELEAVVSKTVINVADAGGVADIGDGTYLGSNRDGALPGIFIQKRVWDKGTDFLE